jgi:RHS repeat-associated protein
VDGTNAQLQEGQEIGLGRDGRNVPLHSSSWRAAHVFEYLKRGLRLRTYQPRRPGRRTRLLRFRRYRIHSAFGVQDDQNGLYFMRARFYSPSQGRFIQPDPAGLGGGSNLYTYASNNPASLADPSGLNPLIWPAFGPNGTLADYVLGEVFGGDLTIQPGSAYSANCAILTPSRRASGFTAIAVCRRADSPD